MKVAAQLSSQHASTEVDGVDAKVRIKAYQHLRACHHVTLLETNGNGPKQQLQHVAQWFSKWSTSTPRGQLDHPRCR